VLLAGRLDPRLPKECSVCHTVLAQAESGTSLIRAAEGVPFRHPVDIGNISQANCSDCHTGGPGP
jgi:hypothetical protein